MKYEDYKTFRMALGGKLLEVEIGKVCELANGQAWIRYGDKNIIRGILIIKSLNISMSMTYFVYPLP